MIVGKHKERDNGLDILLSLLLICVAIFGIWYGVLVSVQKTIDALSPPPPQKTPTPASPSPTLPSPPTTNSPPPTTPDNSTQTTDEDKIDPKVVGIAAGVAVFIITIVFVFTRYSPVQRMMAYASIYSWVFIIGVIFCIVGATSVDGIPRWVCIGIGAFLIFLSWAILAATRRLKIESIVEDAVERLQTRLEATKISDLEKREALMQYKQDTEGVSEAVRLVLHIHGNEAGTATSEPKGWWARFTDLFSFRRTATAAGAAAVAYNNPEFAVKAAIVAALLPTSVYRAIGRLLNYTTTRALGAKLNFNHEKAIQLMQEAGFDEEAGKKWLNDKDLSVEPPKFKQA
jgi:hypothetical protein